MNNSNVRNLISFVGIVFFISFLFALSFTFFVSNEKKKATVFAEDMLSAQIEKDIDEEISATEQEVNNLKISSDKKIRDIAVETSSELIKQLIGEEANNSSISAIVEEQSRKSREKQNGI